MPLADMPQSNKQHAVPQNVMNVEFKLIGDLSMRQFAYVLVGGILAYLCYVFFIGIFRWPLTILVAFFGIGLAFIPVQERGMDEWLINFVRSMSYPTQRKWKKEPTLPSAFMYDDLAMVRQELITLAPTSSRRKLEEYLKYQSSEEAADPLDIPEREYAQKVRDAYPAYKKKKAVRSSEVYVGGVAATAAPAVGVITESETVAEPGEEGILVTQPQTVGQEEVTGQQPSETGETAPEAPAEITGTAIQKPKEAGLFRLFKTKEVQKIRDNSRLAAKANGAKLSESGSASGSSALSPMTPDMHSGRRFINLLPSQGELILPIRGERVLRTTEELSVEESINEKARKLQELLRKIKEDEGIRLQKSAIPPIPVVQKKEQEVQEVHDEAKDVAGILKTHSEELSEEITRLKSNIETTKAPGVSGKIADTQERLLKDLESKQQSVEENYRVLSKGLQNLKGDGSSAPASDLSPDNYPVSNLKPNILQGVVKNKDGKALTDVLLIIKNERQEPVRALKTDSLGRFELLSALENGKYSIEIKPSAELKLSFEKISVELKGEVVSPFVISGK